MKKNLSKLAPVLVVLACTSLTLVSCAKPRADFGGKAISDSDSPAAPGGEAGPQLGGGGEAPKEETPPARTHGEFKGVRLDCLKADGSVASSKEIPNVKYLVGHFNVERTIIGQNGCSLVTPFAVDQSVNEGGSRKVTLGELKSIHVKGGEIVADGSCDDLKFPSRETILASITASAGELVIESDAIACAGVEGAAKDKLILK